LNQKEALIGSSEFKKLPHSTQRYMNAFSELDLHTELLQDHFLNYELSEKPKTFLNQINANQSIIGIAPFAMHRSKEWGIPKINALIKQLSESHTVLLFGGGEKEINELNILAQTNENTYSAAGRFSFREELEIINHLTAMISMDSANMHLASICNTPVVSIWGATHHFLGFGPLYNEENIVEISREVLPCRPVSVYGKISNDKDQECADKAMDMITVEMVLNKLNPLLK